MEAKIAPSILACNFVRLEHEIKKVEEAGADMIHLDIMDGHFVDNLTIGLPVVEAIRKVTKLPLDAHLMISNPEDYVEKYIDAGADSVTFHIEAVAREKSRRKLDEGYTVVFLDEPVIDEERFGMIVEKIKSKGKKAALAYNPSTMLEVVDPGCVKELDMLLIMSVWPGFGGQKFIRLTVDKMRAARANYPDMDIEVDGGITDETIAIASAAGANVFVAGTYVFKSGDITGQVNKLRQAAIS